MYRTHAAFQSPSPPFDLARLEIPAHLLNAILAEAVDDLARRGITIDVYQSAICKATEAAAQDLVKRWRRRIWGQARSGG
ncbi:hypothetical protein GCM10010869_15280 [Mesorhizobium tianshanense]|nr:hypothetical protein GCM10010869_15280 [Mesorhizobium tianshanense]